MNEPKIFLIGDMHFMHRNIIKYCNRPFKDVEDMTEKLIKNWNSVVGKNDIVYVEPKHREMNERGWQTASFVVSIASLVSSIIWALSGTGVIGGN